jgi:arylsulfatase A-like enzyme
MYPTRYGLTYVHKGTKPNVRKILPASKHELPLESVTMAEVLKEQGYATFFAGKWHLGGPALEPEYQGFDINIGGHSRGLPGSYFYPYKSKRLPGADVPDLEDGEEGEYLIDRLTDEALAFMEKKKSSPFLLYLSYYAVHAPLQAPKEIELKTRERFMKWHKDSFRKNFGKAVRYAAMIEILDSNIGRILDKLKELGLEDNTMVVFTSDNGGYIDNSPLKGIKAHSTEGGVRVPLIVRWPKEIEAGTTCKTPACSYDFLPTFMAAVGIERDLRCDGVNIMPLLRGEKIAERPLFWHTPHYNRIYKSEPAGAVRLGDYKLIHFYEEDRFELYNLAEDIGETNDLSASMPEKVTELRRLFTRWASDVGDKMTTEPPVKKM